MVYNVVILAGPPVAKAPDQDTSDGEGRRLGEQTGLDTRVVLCSKLCRLGVALASSECSVEGKPFSLPLGEYGRKIET